MNHIEIKVPIPQERLAEFYRAHAAFLQGNEPRAERPAPPLQRNTKRSRSSSYAPLGERLSTQRKNTVTLEFSEIESILARPLPTSAFRHRAWWANTASHSQAAAWLQRGWQASNLDLQEKAVTFPRTA